MIAELRRTGLLSPVALAHFAAAVAATGPNLGALAQLSARRGCGTALVEGDQSVSYADLARQVEALAAALAVRHAVGPRSRVALLARGGIAGVRHLLAVARLGANLTLLNPDASAAQLADVAAHRRFDLLLHDPEFTDKLAEVRAPRVAYLEALPHEHARVARRRGGELAILTGGTTGVPKAARRRPSAADFIGPFVQLIVRLDLGRRRGMYVATPIHHGFGLAALMVGLALGQTIHLTRRFDAGVACALIAAHRVEAVTLVPTMLARMLAHDVAALAPLRLIACGGAPLDPALAARTLDTLGDALFNMYGTSEAGFCVLATPAMLRAKPGVVGKPIRGAGLKLIGADDAPVPAGETGRLLLRSGWSTSAATWIETGDLGRLDADGDLFLRGRSDEMVVSGGEKAYPVDLEQALLAHPAVMQAAAIGVTDARFGQRLKAFVVVVAGSPVAAPELMAWLDGRIARYQKPVAIEFLDALPLTPIGKVDKRALRALAAPSPA